MTGPLNTPMLASFFGRILALPSLYLLLWGLLAAFTTALVVLMRTEWGRERPTHRYVVLSVVAHLALICLATTVRFMSAPTGEQSTAPVQVRIVMRSAPSPTPVVEQTEPTPPPPELTPEPVPPTPVEPQPAVVEPAPSEPIEPAPALAEAPPLLPAPAERAIEQPKEQNAEPIAESTPEPPKPTPAVTPSAEPAHETPVQQSLPPQDQTVPVETTAVDTAPFVPPIEPVVAERIPTPYGARELAERIEIVEHEGGSRATEDAVAAALAWLASAQSRDGRWDADHWGSGHETRALGHNRSGAGAKADTGITGLALLTMLGGGHSPDNGPYALNLRAGLAYLLRSQTPDGGLMGDSALYAQTYCHSMATFALAEALATTQDRQIDAALRPAVKRATEFLIARQDRRGGGWRYKPGDEGDMSQMGWIIMALRSAELADIDVPPNTWSSIERFVRSAQRGRHGGLACYQPREATSRTMTAESLYCRQILGWPMANTPAGSEAVNHLLGSLPGQGRANYYYWYYASLALHHHRTTSREADSAWRQWNAAMSNTLVSSQDTAGATAGSWSPNSLWGGYGGRVYSTAMAAMCLEVYYRYNSTEVARDPWVAARPGGRLR